MIIRDKNNNLIVDAPVTQKTTRVFRLMESNYVFLSFNYPLFLNIKKGSYIEHEGQKFYCIRNQQPVELKTENGYLYELYFDAVEYWLKTRRFYYSGQGYKEFSFSYTASIDLFAQIIITNANDRFDSTWQFSIGEEVVSRQESITFKARTIFEACTEIANVFETEWWLTSAGETHTIHFGSLMVGNAIEVRKGEIVKDFPVRKGDDSEYGTRFYIYGSTENLPSNYGIAWMHAIDSLAENRLRMPGSQDYIDAWENLADEDVVEQIVRFDAIKPLHNYEVTAVTTDTVNIMEFPGESDIYYWIEVADLLVSFYQGIPPDLLITFESGALNGYSFKPSYVSQWDNNKMKLVPIKDEETGIVLPNVAMAPAVGDKFSISGVDVPQVRVELAEAQLLAAG